MPILLWLYSRPGYRQILIGGLLTGWIGWFVILIWLRHVTWFGTIGLSAVLGALFALWVVFAAWVLPRYLERNFFVRVLGFAAIAGAWVVLEWARSWLLWGFPWAPMSLSQWERPVILQIAAWTGAYGISFLLLFFNGCVAHTLRTRVLQRGRKIWMGWFSPDLYLALGVLGFGIYLFFASLPPRGSAVPGFTAAVVQPYIPPETKWETERELQNLSILEKQTRFVASLESDLVLWPEAATPWPVVGYPKMKARVERLVDAIGKPILMGNLSEDQATKEWRNGTFLVEPGTGLSEQSYAKRELVPFGEYVPEPFGFIDKVVPVGGSFVPGVGPGIIELRLGDSTWRIGSLVCYEDVFPALARESARAGAQIFFVATNNAWYGEEGGAEQHAAHSVLRAVETRRPVMRCGNGGWSGWIDPYGTVREVLRDETGSIYFRGGGTLTVFHFEDWLRRQSFYTRHGDWFVLLSAVLIMPIFALGRRRS